MVCQELKGSGAKTCWVELTDLRDGGVLLHSCLEFIYLSALLQKKVENRFTEQQNWAFALQIYDK